MHRAKMVIKKGRTAFLFCFHQNYVPALLDSETTLSRGLHAWFPLCTGTKSMKCEDERHFCILARHPGFPRSAHGQSRVGREAGTRVS